MGRSKEQKEGEGDGEREIGHDYNIVTGECLRLLQSN